jgi:hypothetical protein
MRLGGMAMQACRHARTPCASQGCDITLAFVPLPCGEVCSLEQVAASTRRLKLSPETYLLRLVAMIICRLFGVRRAPTITLHHPQANSAPRCCTVL